MSNLTSYCQDGLEIFIDNATGESFASINGYARMSGRDKSTISRRLEGVAPELVKKAEVLTAGGLQGVALISEDIKALLVTESVVQTRSLNAKTPTQ
ncbi:hypothetical protein [Anabaena sp. CCY 9402-a]|uniref:hypothetical protein n=1 Tax=Anabaena sp. CCY 9402-a TaxID=3103867 RepID=UPI0039C6054F